MTISDAQAWRLELAPVPFVDNHVHPLSRTQPATPEEFRANFAEAYDPSLAADHVASAVYYRWSLRQLGAFLGVPPTEEEILEQRDSQGFLNYTRGLVSDADIAYLLLDTGFPAPDDAYPLTKMANLLHVRVGHILRIETLLQDLIVEHDSLADMDAAFEDSLQDARKRGAIALKSIAAYRTGLAIENPTDVDAAAALDTVRKSTERPLRLTDKTLIDYFVHRALAFAAREGMPVQFHTGYGDPDLDLRLANPLHLRPLFEDQRYRDAPIVMLHASYPFTAEAAFLAAVYPNAYLDIAYSLPPLGYYPLLRATSTALGTAPASKILASSDGARIPEHYWLGATRARQVLAAALDDAIRAGELDLGAARQTGELILSENAYRIYGLR
ncbi:MAG TPA: amidohydrolase family protein [Chloroflexota bacterium]|nr:amidohydrolase family protein [Chloroflexota bacterium]